MAIDVDMAMVDTEAKDSASITDAGIFPSDGSDGGAGSGVGTGAGVGDGTGVGTGSGVGDGTGFSSPSQVLNPDIIVSFKMVKDNYFRSIRFQISLIYSVKRLLLSLVAVK